MAVVQGYKNALAEEFQEKRRVKEAAASLDKEEKRRRERRRAAEKAGKTYRTKQERDAEAELMRGVLARRGRVRLARVSPTAGMTALQRYRWKMANDPRYVINTRMRVAIRKALKGGKAGRRWESLVGYTVDDLARHLERQMPKGLSLADIGNGRLHIDHIVPKIDFDVTDPAELRAAWALPNLRPVTAEVNLRKNARREFLL
jgi:hypothetical protein